MVTGGARSGKSTFAERWAKHYFAKGTYIATAIPFDLEMESRILQHRIERESTGFDWHVIEEPYELAAQLLQCTNANEVVLVDCLTIWVSNWLLQISEEKKERNVEDSVSLKIEELLTAIQQCKGNMIFVTNEVGAGIVPEYRLGRQFRDLAGILNRKLATLSDSVFLVTAGIPIDLRAQQFTWPKVKGISERL